MQILVALTVRLQPLHYPILQVCLEFVGVAEDVDQQAEDAVDEAEVGLAPLDGLGLLAGKGVGGFQVGGLGLLVDDWLLDDG